MHQRLANATFQVISGNFSGSGFSFISKDVVITNYHVISNLVDVKQQKTLGQVKLRCENETELFANIELVDVSNDFAILRLQDKLPEGREVLQPLEPFEPKRGLKLMFGGFPHGIPHLLINEAILSATFEHGRFYLDGMVNGGNSGGPILDAESGKVIGIVTQRRYLGGDDGEVIAKNATQLLEACKRTTGTVAIGGIDFAKLNKMYAELLSLQTSK